MVDNVPANFPAQRQALHSVKVLGDECAVAPAPPSRGPEVTQRPGAHSLPLCPITMAFVVPARLVRNPSGFLGSDCTLPNSGDAPGLAGVCGDREHILVDGNVNPAKLKVHTVWVRIDVSGYLSGVLVSVTIQDVTRASKGS